MGAYFNTNDDILIFLFSAGNGKIDLLVKYGGFTYGIELKSVTNEMNYKDALNQAAKYAKQLTLPEVFLVFFIESVDWKNREKYEALYLEKSTGITAVPLFIETGN